MRRSLVIGADTGGTFTDFVMVNGRTVSTYKVPSTPFDYSAGVMEGVIHLTSAFPGSGFTLSHSTTVATNALLEGRGARVAMVATKGFRDVLALGRQNRSSLYDLYPVKSDPLVPASRCFEVDERVAPDGTVLRRISPADLDALADRVAACSPDVVAVCLLFSFKNPAHEKKVARALRKRGLTVCLSCDILPEFREYERAGTTVVNAFVSPVMTEYLGRLRAASRRRGCRQLRIMQSNGGSLDAGRAGEQAVHTLLSGPAAGITGAMSVAGAALGTGAPLKLITFDMGGTSTDVALIDGGVSVTTGRGIAGHPVGVPMMDIHTVGAGGGSAASVDPGGALLVGPRSTGADPGPACYGKGVIPAVTDANLVLGRLHPDCFLGGRRPLHEDRARRAMEGLGKKIGLDAAGAARAVLRIVNSNMERAIRVISVERGHDARDFTLVSFGGAGGLHACEVADALGMRRVLVPVNPGVLSAWGALCADMVRDVSRTVMLPEAACGSDEIEQVFLKLEKDGVAALRRDGVDTSRMTARRLVDVRYAGQSFEIPVSYHRGGAGLRAGFEEEHRRLYGHASADDPIELVTARVTLVIPTKKPPLTRRTRPSPAGSTVQGRTSSGLRVVARDDVSSANAVRGPLVIVEDYATTYLAPGWSAKADVFGNLLLTRAGR